MGFDASSVSVLSYDFTSFPKDGAVDPSERCSGKGRIPEPSHAKIDAFFKGHVEVLDKIQQAADPDAVLQEVEEEAYQRLSEVCSGTPSVDELKQLPPRILFAFAKYLAENLAPKA